MSDDLITFAQLLGRSITDKVTRELSVGGLQPATVTGFPPASAVGLINQTVMVHLDSDPDTADFNFEVTLLTNSVPVVGDRVMVLRDPPWGAYAMAPLVRPDSNTTMVCRIGLVCTQGGG